MHVGHLIFLIIFLILGYFVIKLILKGMRDKKMAICFGSLTVDTYAFRRIHSDIFDLHPSKKQPMGGRA